MIAVLVLVSCSRSKEISETKFVDNDEIITQEDDSMLVGESEIIQEQQPQEIEITYKVTVDFFNNEQDREVIKETILSEGKPTIKKVGTKEIKEVEEMVTDDELEIITQQDDTLEYLQEVVVQEGVLGQLKITYEETYIKGKLTDRREVKYEEIVKSEPKIIKTNSVKSEVVYDNTDLSWWYQPGKPTATISSDVAEIIEPFNVLWQIPTDEKIVYLTFDQGYEYNNNTNKILDTLKLKGVKATFFVTGSYVDRNPEIVKRMVDEGHQVGNHSVNHYRAAPTIDESLEKYINDIKDLESKVDGMSKLHRPPEGGYSQQSLSILDDLGYTTVFWSFAYRDWLTDDQPNRDDAFDKITSNIHPGSILLLHSVSDTNTNILSDVIDNIHNQGYRIGQLQP